MTTADGLAVDWIYNHIYWTDTGKNTIELASYEGNMRKVLIKDDLEEPRAIAVNPLEGYKKNFFSFFLSSLKYDFGMILILNFLRWMYWTDWGSEPKIERAGMDGSHRQVIVSYEMKWPNGLTLDLVLKKIYWADAKMNTISSCNFDGTNRRIILFSQNYLQHPFSITTFEDLVYWTDWDKKAVYKANKFTGKDVVAVTATHMVYDFLFYLIKYQNLYFFTKQNFFLFFFEARKSNGDSRLPSVQTTGRNELLSGR